MELPHVNGIIFDIKKFAIHDGPGIRTTVFFKGCSLDCWWCHNPEGRKLETETVSVKPGGDASDSRIPARTEVIGRDVSVASVMEEILKDVIFYDQSGGGVTFSGGEPMMQPEFLIELLQLCKENSLNTAVDTSGYASWDDFEKIYNLIDLFLYDLKLMDDESHIKYTGVSNELILENLARLSSMGSKIEPRIPLIPGITDTEENLEAIAEFLTPRKNIRQVVLLPYNRLGEDKSRKFDLTYKAGQLSVQSGDELENKVEIFRSHGYGVRIGG
jgi:pyruvate formate lyase activating enzyme